MLLTVGHQFLPEQRACVHMVRQDGIPLLGWAMLAGGPAHEPQQSSPRAEQSPCARLMNQGDEGSCRFINSKRWGGSQCTCS